MRLSLRVVARRQVARPSAKRFSTSRVVAAELKQSHVVGSTSVPIIEKTYDGLLQSQIDAYPHKDLHRASHENIKLTFAQAKTQIDGLANGLAEVIGEGHDFASAIGLRSEALVAQMGAPRGNNVFVALQPGSIERLEAELKCVNPHALLWTARLGDTVQLEEIYKLFPYLANDGPFQTAALKDPRFPNLRSVFHNAKKNLNGLSWFKNLLVTTPYGDPLAKQKTRADPKADASVLVTRDLKQLALSQFAIINTANSVGSIAGISDEDITLSTLPLHFAAGQVLGLTMAVVRRSQLVISHDVFNAQKALNALKSENCSAMVAFPHEWLAIAALPDFAKLRPASLKKGVIVTNSDVKADHSTVERIKEAFGLRSVVTTFGTEETSGVFLANNQVLPNTQAKVVDASGKTLPSGTRGQLLVKGPNVMNGYRNSQQATQQAIDADHWLRTGLTGTIDQNGSVQIL